MKIVDKKTFLTLPEGTFYSKGKKWYFNDISIKGGSLNNDWYYLEFNWPKIAKSSEEAFETLERCLNTGESFESNDCWSRDGLFEEDDLFIIFEKADLLNIRDLIDQTLRA